MPASCNPSLKPLVRGGGGIASTRTPSVPLTTRMLNTSSKQSQPSPQQPLPQPQQPSSLLGGAMTLLSNGTLPYMDSQEGGGTCTAQPHAPYGALMDTACSIISAVEGEPADACQKMLTIADLDPLVRGDSNVLPRLKFGHAFWLSIRLWKEVR